MFLHGSLLWELPRRTLPSPLRHEADAFGWAYEGIMASQYLGGAAGALVENGAATESITRGHGVGDST